MRADKSTPLIGITAANDPKVPGHYILRWDYVHGVEAAGGIPVILAPSSKLSAAAILKRLDGLILSGGHDISPEFYGGQPHRTIRDPSKDRDQFEFDLVNTALQDKIPMLGICRGIQILNVVLGGDIIQDIPEHIGDSVAHDEPGRPREVLAHEVSITPESRLFQVVETSRLRVNSFHHQAVGKLGSGLIKTAVARDGVIEGIELPGHPFMMGIQWHPETLWSAGAPFFNFFESIVEAAMQK
ncbi:MAG: gamma-glutamyl-gamma-aminobutyrate hydrolase family protein [Motiliproteus sp.]|nr:gamma-glutamyl-gamma-aminobutyrate hydrolase family protein [Motiliproteus sp.]MCW9053093.1 gamma-glutamyl-gamma-aminobutyrate hydrolase family protein [Motiliproteus sp.]